MNIVYECSLKISGINRVIRLINDDMSKTDEQYDVAVCSAFKQDYTPTRSSLIGALYYNKGISVESLSKDCEIGNFKEDGGWLSKELDGNFKRILCVEITDLYNYQSVHQREIRGSFSTMRYLLERLEIRNIPLRKLAMPVLGSGDQQLEIEYVAPALFNNIMGALENVAELTAVDIYEINEQKASRLKQLLESILLSKYGKLLFISHSHVQADVAHQLVDIFSAHDIPCWIAPDSIPAGKEYLDEIPAVIANSFAVLALVTPEAETSRWVKRELEAAINGNVPIIPCLLQNYPVGAKFAFILGDHQRFSLNRLQAEKLEELIKTVLQRKNESKNAK